MFCISSWLKGITAWLSGSSRLLDGIIGSIVYNWFIEFLQRSKPPVSGGVGGYFLPGHLHMGLCTCALAYLFTYLSIYFQDQEVPSLQPMVKVLPEFPSFQRVWNTAGRLPYDYHMISITLPQHSLARCLRTCYQLIEIQSLQSALCRPPPHQPLHTHTPQVYVFIFIGYFSVFTIYFISLPVEQSRCRPNGGRRSQS